MTSATMSRRRRHGGKAIKSASPERLFKEKYDADVRRDCESAAYHTRNGAWRSVITPGENDVVIRTQDTSKHVRVSLREGSEQVIWLRELYRQHKPPGARLYFEYEKCLNVGHGDHREDVWMLVVVIDFH